jgi:WD40 repeat protein
MLNKLIPRLGPTTRFLLGLAGILALMLVTAAAWWLLSARPRISIQAPAECNYFVVSADGQTLATSHTQSLILWDLASAEIRKSLPINRGSYPPSTDDHAHQHWLSPDGQTVVYVERDARMEQPVTSLKLWNATCNQEPVLLTEAVRVETFLAGSVVTQGNGSITIWDAVSGQQRKSWKREEGFIRHPASAWAVGDDLLVVQPNTHTLIVCDAHTLTERFRFPGIDFQQIAVLGTAQAKLLAAAEEGSVTVWDLTTGQKLGSFLLPLDGQAGSGSARCLTTGERLAGSLPLKSSCRLLRLSADGVHLLGIVDTPPSTSPGEVAFVPGNFRLYRWDLPPSSSMHPPEQQEFLSHTPDCLSPDGQFLFHHEGTGSPLLSCTATKQPPTPLLGLDIAVSPTSFAPNSKILAGVSQSQPGFLSRWLDGPEPNYRLDLKLWNVATGRELAVFKDNLTFTFFPDGNSLVTRNDEGVFEIWDIPPLRPWWIDYGLPVLFVFLILVAGWHSLRFRKKVGSSAQFIASDALPDMIPSPLVGKGSDGG